MAITTYAAFIAALSGLTVTGVTRSYTEPPHQVSTADMPLSYVQLPDVGEGPMTAEGEGGWPRLRAELVILVEPIGQNVNGVNFALCVTLIDNLSTALRGTSLAKTKTRWTIRQESIQQYGDTAYWAIIATVEANG